MDSANDVPPARPSHQELLEFEIELRLRDVLTWALADGISNDAVLVGFLRLAYVTGYSDALVEPTRGELFRAHGYEVPTKRPRRQT